MSINIDDAKTPDTLICPTCGQPDVPVTAEQTYAEHPAGTRPCPASGQPHTYRDGTWVTAGPVRVCFEDIGEGLLGGDYDEENPEDAAVYRLDVQVHASAADDRAESTDDPAWLYPEDGSICTAVRTDTPGPRVMDILATAAADLREVVQGGGSIRSTMDRLSWLS